MPTGNLPVLDACCGQLSHAAFQPVPVAQATSSVLSSMLHTFMLFTTVLAHAAWVYPIELADVFA